MSAQVEAQPTGVDGLLQQMIAYANGAAGDGCTQEALVAALRQRYPGLPNENYYQNTAAQAVMRRIRAEQRRQQGIAADKARLRAKGLPESLAEREPRPEWTDSDQDPEWRGPLHSDVAACVTAYDLAALCERHDLHLSVDEFGLKLSRRIACDSELLKAIRRHKAALTAFVVARDAALESDET